MTKNAIVIYVLDTAGNPAYHSWKVTIVRRVRLPVHLCDANQLNQPQRPRVWENNQSIAKIRRTTQALGILLFSKIFDVQIHDLDVETGGRRILGFSQIQKWFEWRFLQALRSAKDLEPV